MNSFVPFQSTSACVSARPSARTRSSFHVRVVGSSLKMWKSLLMTSHMLAHHAPSLNHRMLSARLVPVGVPRPVSVEPAASTPAGGDDGTVLANVTGSPPAPHPPQNPATPLGPPAKTH